MRLELYLISITFKNEPLQVTIFVTKFQRRCFRNYLIIVYNFLFSIKKIIKKKALAAFSLLTFPTFHLQARCILTEVS